MCVARLQVDAAIPRPAHRWKRLEETVRTKIKVYLRFWVLGWGFQTEVVDSGPSNFGYAAVISLESGVFTT